MCLVGHLNSEMIDSFFILPKKLLWDFPRNREVVRADASPSLLGEAGELAITNTINCSMPLISCRIGDSAIPPVFRSRSWMNCRLARTASCSISYQKLPGSRKSESCQTKTSDGS